MITTIIHPKPGADWTVRPHYRSTGAIGFVVLSTGQGAELELFLKQDNVDALLQAVAEAHDVLKGDKP